MKLSGSPVVAASGQPRYRLAGISRYLTTVNVAAATPYG
jgi:hypothetical protein